MKIQAYELPKRGLLGQANYEAISKKESLFDKSYWRYAVRSLYATLFLTLGTSVALIAAERAEHIVAGSGKYFFAFFFSWSLVLIVYMNGELATSNMMYMTIAVNNRYLSLSKAMKILFTCVAFNLIGGILFTFAISQTTVFQTLPADHFLYTVTAGKLSKSILQLFIEGVFANIVVNTSVFATNRMVNGDGRVFSIVFIIFMFAFLGFEHVIANFCIFPLTFFCNHGMLDGMTLGAVLINYIVVFLGNYVGGGLFIGLVYSWLNKNQTQYLD